MNRLEKLDWCTCYFGSGILVDTAVASILVSFLQEQAIFYGFCSNPIRATYFFEQSHDVFDHVKHDLYYKYSHKKRIV